MAPYIEFVSSPKEGADRRAGAGGQADGTRLLVEVSTTEIAAGPGVQKAGLRDVARAAVAEAQNTLQEAISNAIQFNAEAFLTALDSLSDKPTEAEMSFTLKATGESGNIAVGKVGGEANYTVKLVWKQ
jgi:hypothetical protein